MLCLERKEAEAHLMSSMPLASSSFAQQRKKKHLRSMSFIACKFIREICEEEAGCVGGKE